MYMFYRLANQKREIYVNDIVSDRIQSSIPWMGDSKKTDQKIGVVVTTHGMWGVHVRQCLECYQRHLTNLYIVVYINESDDEITLGLKDRFPEFEVIFIEDQTKFGGLTGTWNAGIDKCIENECDIIVLSNDDILFDQSIHAILWEASQVKSDELVYFGPLTNNPGISKQNRPQYGVHPRNRNTEVMTYQNSDRYQGMLVNLNKFFMVFPKHVLLANRFDETTYFNPKYPFGGNEYEWFERFHKKGGLPKIVYRTFIYHYKYERFSENQSYKKTCLYTINTGGYEKDRINLHPKLPIDHLYFTDQFELVYQCIQKGIIPYYVTGTDSKLVQRTVKTSPHHYIPAMYEQSIYIDGNVYLSGKFTKQVLDNFIHTEKPMICFHHPDRQTIQSESRVVLKQNLETKRHIDTILTNQKKDQFPDTIGLTETNVLIRKHKPIKEFSEEWTHCIEVCRRDQLSFDYLLWKHKVDYERLSHSEKVKLITKKPHVNPKTRTVM